MSKRKIRQDSFDEGSLLSILFFLGKYFRRKCAWEIVLEAIKLYVANLSVYSCFRINRTVS